MGRKCNPSFLWLTQLIRGILPSTRFFLLNRSLLSMSGVDIHATARVCSSVRILTSGHLTIGAGTFVGHEVLIAGGAASISVGNCCDIAPRVTLVSGAHDIASAGPRAAGPGNSKPIIIEDGVWIGTGSIVLGGVRIGQHSVIGAGSVVACDIPQYCVALGSPCRVLQQIPTEAEV